MPKNDQNEESTSILAKVGSFLGRGVKATGQVLALVPKALIYPIKKPFASMGEMKHDATVSLKEAVGIDVPEEEEEYDPPIETTQASKNLGVQITEQKKGTGKVSFLASRTLTGDIPYLSPGQLDKIKKDLPNVTIFREENKIVIEINVEEIANTIKNKGKSEKEIKELVIKGIANKIDEDLKRLAKITGGEFKIHTDLKLLNGIAEKLYKEYDNQKQSSEATKPAGLTSSEGLLKAGQPSVTIASGEKKWAQEAIKPGKSQSCGMQK
ncbi:hypothetical protein [Wolbachia endosymbiont (group A) of Cheilosia soror]|uniref:hypothetical protein n=1 Tax=Wolbachia endosymbiont (group A) of Cheilosia soror TaxID=2953995 RepID=UPI0021F8F447|nr:hypothetical protein [Wolbachia endosymbiont (group A) of Cheilosia soror]